MRRVQSFGAGVQSVAMLRMVVAGEIERPDLVVFSDTGSEPQHVYEVVEREKRVCERAGIEFATVARHHALTDVRLSKNGTTVLYAPLYTIDLKSGKHGQLLRSCTDKFKIAPIRQHLAARGWKPEGVELWLGMTTDEIQRVKPSWVQWVTHRWPLVELNLRRSDCIGYLNRLGLEAAKSACFMCPYRSSVQWLEVKANPADWELAVRYDRRIRHARPGFECFVHPSRVPLDQVSFDNEHQVSLWDSECDGICAA